MALVKVDALPGTESESVDSMLPSQGPKLVKVSGPPPPQYDTGEESTLGYLGRGAARTGSALGQGVLDLAQAGPNMLKPRPNEQRQIESLFSQLQGREEDQELPEQGLNISEQSRGALDQATRGYTAPQTEGEEAYDDFMRTVGSAIPGGAATALQRMALAGLSHVAGNVVGNLTGNDQAGVAASISAPVIAILATKGARSVYRPLYNQAQKAIPPNARVTASPIGQELRDLGTTFKQSAEATEYRPINTFIKNTQKEFSRNPRLKVNRLWDMKRYASEKAAEAGQKNFLTGKRANLRQQKAWLDVYNVLNKELHQYAQSNPGFSKYFFPAEEAFRASKIGGEAMKRYEALTKSMGISNPIARQLLHSMMGTPFAGRIASEAAVALSRRGIEAARSPTLRGAYGRNVSQAARPGLVGESRSE